MIDDMLVYLQNVRSQQTHALSPEVIEDICVPLSDEGEGEEKVYEVFQKSILPNSLVVTSPRFWGLVVGTGSPYGMLAELLSSGMNSMQEFMFAEAQVNNQAINWIKELLGFPKEAGGVFVSGGSEANFTALAVARNAKAQVDVKSQGVQALKQKMTLYVSEESHHSIERAVELLGLGNEALRKIPTDDHCQVKLDALQEAIEEDRKNNCHPFCIIGCAGTTNSGAFDDLTALAEIAKKEGMWFHVDGAFGAWVKISQTHRHLADGMELADSLAVDLHKWMNMPYGVGCTIVKDRLAHFSTFVYGHEAQYLKSAFKISENELINPHNLAIPLSREFSSLKVYMLLRAYGKNKYRRLVQQNLDQALYLASLIEKDPELELAAPVASNIVCFRVTKPGLTGAQLEKLNKAILAELNHQLFLCISDTTIKGKYMLRAAIVNHRTQKQDLDYLIAQIKQAAQKISIIDTPFME